MSFHPISILSIEFFNEKPESKIRNSCEIKESNSNRILVVLNKLIITTRLINLQSFF